MFTISVCMIIKNEEKVLDRILSCAKKFADEIIIVDTGSTDNSINIAKKYTTNIYTFEWIDNFSEARNFSFSKATKDYIMWLDADDYIPQTEIDKIVNLKNTTIEFPSMFLFKYCMGFENETPTFEFYRERLIKRSANLQWQGFIHEVIPITPDAKYLDINIEHRKIDSPNPKRNLNIYRKAKKRKIPFTPRDTYYYARELYYNNYYYSALKEFKKFLKSKDIYPANEIEASILINNICVHLKDIPQAKKYLFRCLSKHAPNPELCCAIGNVFYLENNYNSAIFWYNLALKTEYPNTGFHEKDYIGFIPHLQLCVIYYTLGNLEKSKHHHLECKKIKPNHPSVKHNDNFFKKIFAFK